ncbi:L-2-hydroxyglutarate oxidase [Streptomyces sulphureus]|uniref:L-2-hydroxyglutarate oxidase n=1 Tax=Streptomyces sulphureus TaxID=47758 RepID=UPI00036ED42E|nr:L-2-hydroxyglutarate oxidase [Streptomyces sulphureus]
MSHTTAAVIGGGIIGLAVARELHHALPDADITVFEKEAGVATQQTGHNSGVVHAGLYYEPGSLKARLCRRGVELLAEYADRHDVRYEACGKLVVAQNQGELERLHAIHARAVANGVPDVRMIGPAEIKEIEPHARGIAALHSPHTAIVDYPGIARALASDVEAAGGQVKLGHEVKAVHERSAEAVVVTEHGEERFDLVITCAGLQSDRLARSSGDASAPAIVPFFGDYFLLRRETAELVKGLIYPVPDPRYPFLGVHLTRRIDGTVVLGPNAFLSLAREGYQRGTISLPDLREAVGSLAFWRFAARNIPAAFRESKSVLSTRSFVEQARTYVPEISLADVRRGPRGIRAQAMHADGSLADDFVITGTSRVLHIRNAPSPGATSSLAIAEHIVREALNRKNPQIAES